jgi:hypothetical protein
MPSANPLIVFEVHHQLFVVPTVVASQTVCRPANNRETEFHNLIRYLALLSDCVAAQCHFFETTGR